MAIKLKPDYALAHNNLGNALFAEGKIEEAISHYKMAIKLKPDYALAHNNLGTCSGFCCQKNLSKMFLIKILNLQAITLAIAYLCHFKEEALLITKISCGAAQKNLETVQWSCSGQKNLSKIGFV